MLFRMCLKGRNSSRDFNGHTSSKANGYDITHGGFGYGVRNSGGVSILDFAVTYDLMIVNSHFRKEDHLVTFRSGNTKTQLDYFFIRTSNRMLCKDSKVKRSEHLDAT